MNDVKRLPLTPENMRRTLDGAKTMTRRVILPQPEVVHERNRLYANGREIRPKYVPGDVAMLTSTWAVDEGYDDYKPTELSPHDAGKLFWLSGDGGPKPLWAGKSRPAMFAPLALADFFPKARITAVKVERVQNISVADMVAEGLVSTLREHDAVCDLRDQWIALWDSINAKRGYGWDANPWVFAYTYEVVR
ncbi:MAG: hypothetical protein AB7E55_33945, partial [Pigmentiphaga sp.]